METPGPRPEPDAVELLLVTAALDPVKRGEFTKALLDATVLVPGRPVRANAPAPEERTGLRKGELVEFHTLQIPDGRTAIPFYTSRYLLQSQVPAGTPLIEMATRDFFTVTAGAVLVLNYGAARYKTFEPSEVRQLLENGWASETRAFERAQPVQLRVPSSQPTAMFAAMTSVLATVGKAEVAYFGQIRYSEEPELAHFLIGLVGGEGVEEDIPHLGPVAAATAPDAPTDFIVIGDETDGVTAWLREYGFCWFRRSAH
jgi:hypothetical protein